MHNKALLISEDTGDFLPLMQKAFDALEIVTTAQADSIDFSSYSAVVVLGGGTEYGVTLLPPVRSQLESAMKKGTRVFAEFARVSNAFAFAQPVHTEFSRPIGMQESTALGSFPKGMILDEQWNERLPVETSPADAEILFQYVDQPRGFYQADVLPEKQARRAAFILHGNLLVCTFRMFRFARARFSPKAGWAALLAGVMQWLGGHASAAEALSIMNDVYAFSGKQPYSTAVDRAFDWFQKADIIVHYCGQPYAVMEGVSSQINAFGETHRNRQLRLDCTGEAAWLYLLKYLKTKDPKALAACNGLFRMLRDLPYKDGPLRGFTPCSLGWWQKSNYGDDTARGFLLPMLWKRLFLNDQSDDDLIAAVAQFLISTAGEDGLRYNRIMLCSADGDSILAAKARYNGKKWENTPLQRMRMADIPRQPTGSCSVHHNGYWLGAVALAGKLLKRADFIAAAEKGMGALMAAYPNTAREHSKTQEMCRFILPLALLYYSTGKTAYRSFLERIVQDLEKVQDASGGYLEFDEGYTAIWSHGYAAECSVFSSNGDPVCDLLYSNNWVLQGFMLAYIITGDSVFKKKWEESAQFLCACQLKSKDALLDGAWARAADVRGQEVFGVNADKDWSCFTIESGWTVAEIAAGLLLGLSHQTLEKYFHGSDSP